MICVPTILKVIMHKTATTFRHDYWFQKYNCYINFTLQDYALYADRNYLTFSSSPIDIEIKCIIKLNRQPAGFVTNFGQVLTRPMFWVGSSGHISTTGGHIVCMFCDKINLCRGFLA